MKGSENRDTLVTSAAVGWATSLRKRHEEASQILLETEHKLERVCGTTHFETLYCRVARAQAELEMSKQYRREPEQPSHDGNDDARETERLRLTQLSDEKGNLGVALLESVIPHLPPGEPERAEVESMVAWAYYWMGSSERGATMQERALAVQLDKLGADHPETFVSFVELGFRYLELDRNSEAAGMFDRAFQGPIITETPGDKEYYKALERGITQAYKTIGEVDKLREAKAKFRALRRRPRMERMGVRRTDEIDCIINVLFYIYSLIAHSSSPIDINSVFDIYSVVEFGANHLLLEQKLWAIHCDAYQNIDGHQKYPL